jgi:2-keto-4-pentenoate hydratase/2-oxohepta-3-ene-1,7-dioic acid hydratase in catechol pathway
MHIGRFRDHVGAAFWGTVDTVARTVRPIDGPFREWAPAVARADPPPLRAGVHRLSDLRPLAPVEPAGRVFGVGANYKVHLDRFAVEAPPEPVVYIKPDSALVDPGAVISYPATTQELDYEVELVAVLAGPLRPEHDPTASLLGFTVGNDVSARDARSPFGGPDLYGMKALDATTPVGPWIATPEEFGGRGQPRADIRLSVNGALRQQDNTENMIWSVSELLSYVNARTALRGGDIVFTGTTAGVGLEDGTFLQPGDLVEAEIAGIGLLGNTVGQRPDRTTV